jgi:hypothetical protein
MNPETTEKPTSVRDAVRQITIKTLSSIETVVDAASNSQEPDAVTLRDLARQSLRSGVAFGRLSNAVVGQMSHTIAGLAKAQIKTGRRSLRTGGALLAGTASGVLAGIAERMQPASANKSDQSKPVRGD